MNLTYPFDLPKAISGSPIQTIQGYPMKFVAYRSDAAKRERLIVMDQMGNIQLYSDSGYPQNGFNAYQLCMGSGTVKIFMNIYQHMNTYSGQGFKTKEFADKMGGPSRIMRLEFDVPT